MPNTWDKQSNNPYVNAGNSIGQMIAMMAGGGENIRAKAEAEGALSAAQAYSQNMLGNERWANARGLNMTADNRASIPAMIATAGESMPQYKRDALEMFGLTGDTNMDRFASAMQRTQQVDYADRALANPSQRANLSAALAAGDGKQMFDNVGNTGVAQNRYTGEMNVANQALLDLFSNLESSKVTENNAQANAANTLADVRKQEVANGGAGGGSAGGAKGGADRAISTLARDAFLTKPALNAYGEPVVDMYGNPVKEVDSKKVIKLKKWADANGIRVSDDALMQWAALNFPDAPANPAPAQQGVGGFPNFAAAVQAELGGGAKPVQGSATASKLPISKSKVAAMAASKGVPPDVVVRALQQQGYAIVP